MRKVLIVDDQRDVLSLLEEMFRENGFDVIALSYVPRIEDIFQEKPDVVILDLLMPGTAGYTIGKAILEQRQGKLPLVFLISGRSKDILCQKSEQIGADGWITKPFRVEDILEPIKNLLDKNSS